MGEKKPLATIFWKLAKVSHSWKRRVDGEIRNERNGNSAIWSTSHFKPTKFPHPYLFRYSTVLNMSKSPIKTICQKPDLAGMLIQGDVRITVVYQLGMSGLLLAFTRFAQEKQTMTLPTLDHLRLSWCRKEQWLDICTQQIMNTSTLGSRLSIGRKAKQTISHQNRLMLKPWL